MFNQKIIQLIVLAIFTVFILQGCRKIEGESKKKVKLVLLDVHFIRWIDMHNKIIKEFEKENPHIDVQLITAPDYLARLLTMIAGGVPPDIVFMEEKWVHHLASRGALVELCEFIEKDKEFNLNDYYSVIVRDAKYNGKIYWLPSNFSTIALFYNKTLFDEAGIEYPNEKWTWKEFLEAAKKLTKDKDGDGKIDQYGYGQLWGLNRWPIMVWQNNGEVFNKDGTKCLMDSREAIEAMQFCYDLEHKYKVSPTLHELEHSGQDFGQMFIANKIAMILTSRYGFEAFREAKNLKWDVSVPFRQKRRATIYIAGGYSIVKGSKHPEEAWKFLKFLVGKVGATFVAEAGRGLPALKSVAEKAVIHPGIPPENDKVFCELIKYARVAPDVKIPSEIHSRLDELFWLMRTGKITPEELCKRYAKIVNETLSKEKVTTH